MGTKTEVENNCFSYLSVKISPIANNDTILDGRYSDPRASTRSTEITEITWQADAHWGGTHGSAVLCRPRTGPRFHTTKGGIQKHVW